MVEGDWKAIDQDEPFSEEELAALLREVERFLASVTEIKEAGC